MFRKHPPGLATLFFSEMWERFSFYIMLALLTLYMEAPTEKGGLGFSQFWSSQIYGMYIGLIYFTPFFGGIVADKIWGYSKTIIAGGVSMMAGHLALAGDGLAFFFAGLALLIIGNGLFKPNISSMLGNLYKDRADLKDQGYSIFYMGINVGALMAPIIATILKRYGWHYAFSCASVGMALSLVVFWVFRRSVAEGEVPAFKAEKDNEVPVAPEVVRLRTRALLIIFAVVVFFWMAFKQNGSTLIRWSRDFTASLETPVGTLNFYDDASITKAINPFLVIALTPLLVLVWTKFLFGGREISTPKKMVLGMALTAVSCLVMVLAGLAGGDARKVFVDKIDSLNKEKKALVTADDAMGVKATVDNTPRLSEIKAEVDEMQASERVSVLWLIVAYFFITLGELCISPMGLSVVSQLAPKGTAGTWMGGWFVSTSVGNYLAGLVGIFWEPLLPSRFFLMLVATSLVSMVLLIAFLPRLEAALESLKKPTEVPEDHTQTKRASEPAPVAGS